MTIAMCYLSPEGVVFGADSTATFGEPGLHFYNHNQKIFEVGSDSTLAIMTWGMGGLTGVSYRTLAAQLGQEFFNSPPVDGQAAAAAWVRLFGSAYQGEANVQSFLMLHGMSPYIPGSVAPGMRSEAQDKAYHILGKSLRVGFCIGGRVSGGFEPFAYELQFSPLDPRPKPDPIAAGKYRFWGVPDVIERIYKGFDAGLPAALKQSGGWAGDDALLTKTLAGFGVEHPIIPIRDAVDFVHSSVYITIKTLKFSYGAQVCGGPIEMAVITTDRNFRWVRHKPWDAAILDGERYDR